MGMVKLVSLEMPPKSLVKMAKTAEDADVTKTPLRSHVTTMKRLKKQPTPLQMTLNFEGISDAAAVEVAVDADVGTRPKSLLQMVKLVNHDKLVSLEMPPKSHVTTMKRPKKQPTPLQMTSNFEGTSDAAAVDADVGTRPKSLVKMVKTANAAQDAAVTMIPLRNHVTTRNRLKVLFLHFADYFEVGTVRPESLLPTDRLVNLVT